MDSRCPPSLLICAICDTFSSCTQMDIYVRQSNSPDLLWIEPLQANMEKFRDGKMKQSEKIYKKKLSFEYGLFQYFRLYSENVINKLNI